MIPRSEPEVVSHGALYNTEYIASGGCALQGRSSFSSRAASVPMARARLCLHGTVQLQGFRSGPVRDAPPPPVPPTLVLTSGSRNSEFIVSTRSQARL